MKVSVIVPVYNVEKYIDRCLNSLLSQTLDDIEFIIVNDGSPDNSEKIIKKYLKKSSKFKYYIKENGGLSDARNYGLKYANGEYIAFLDSDDYVESDMYQKMYEKAISNNFDMVVCDINYDYGSKLIRVSSNIKNDTNSIKKIMNKIYPAACNKLFNKTLFNYGINFKKNVWFEDVEFIYRLLPYIKSIGVCDYAFYYYLQREGSIINTIDSRIYNYIDNFNGIIKFYKERKLYDEYFKELEYSYVRYIYATFIKSVSRYNYQDYLKAVDVAIENVHEHFPKYRHNAYFYKSLKGLYLILFNKFIAKIYYKIRSR